MIFIKTFGQFDIQYKDKSLMNDKSYQYRIIRLLKYFLTYRNKMLLPETIIEDLWGYKDYKDPKSVLRTQISRLRRLIILEGGTNKTCYDIKFINGYYMFTCKSNCLLDIDLMEQNINRGDKLKELDINAAIEAYKDGLYLYKGRYLKELEFEEWVVPIRSKYHRKYMQSLINYLDLLKSQNRYIDIVRMCEEAVLLEDYNEDLHIHFIEALIEIGEKDYAQTHYEYFSSKLYTHLGGKPSNRLKKAYSKIKYYNIDKKRDFDILRADEELGYLDENTGVLICDMEEFGTIYALEKRKAETNKEKSSFLGIIALENTSYIILSKDILLDSMDKLIDVTRNNLKSGDVIFKWNDKQLLTIIDDLEEENIEELADRLKKSFNDSIGNKNIIINIVFKHII